jgi:hypothetical protein
VVATTVRPSPGTGRGRGKTGWKISVVTVPTTARAAREIFRQDVLAQPIVADIALVVVEAIRRGDKLWAEDE